MSTTVESVRMLLNYAKLNEIHAYVQNEKNLMRLAQLMEERKPTGLKARDLHEVMHELGYGVEHYLETMLNWNSKYQAPKRPWDAASQDDKPHPAVRRYVEIGFGRGRVLEIGCGDGANARFIASRGGKLVAIDVARPIVESNRARALKEGTDCEFICNNVFEFDATPGQFDAVLDCWCFHHIPAHLMVSYAERVARLLRPGGHFLLLCHAPHSSQQLSLTDGLSGPLPKAIAYIVHATSESVLSRSEIRDVFSEHFEIGPIELHHDTHIRHPGHYSFVCLLTKRG